MVPTRCQRSPGVISITGTERHTVLKCGVRLRHANGERGSCHRLLGRKLQKASGNGNHSEGGASSIPRLDC